MMLEGDIHPISPKSQPHNTNLWTERRERKKIEDYSTDRAALANKKSIGPALEICQFHTIEYGVSKIVPEGH